MVCVRVHSKGARVCIVNEQNSTHRAPRSNSSTRIRQTCWGVALENFIHFNQLQKKIFKRNQIIYDIIW